MRPLPDRALLRALASFGVAYTAEWSFTVAIGLVAYDHGGALAVGLVGVLRLLPAALLAPVISTFADRLSRERVLVLSGVVRGLAMLAAALVLVADGPIFYIYVGAVVSTIAFTPFRASHSALMPSLCRRPEELTSVNVARGTLYSSSLFVGPLVAAGLIDIAGLAAVCVFASGAAILSALLVLRLRYERVESPGHDERRFRGELRDGFLAASSTPGVGVVLGLIFVQTVMRGAWTVFVVVVAVDLLGRSDGSVGVLQSAVGLGALAGSLGCTVLIGSRAMARWLAIGVVLWGLPLALIGLAPTYDVALVAAAGIGVGAALSDVTSFTLLARSVPDTLLARVYGIREGLGALGVCIGSLAAPALIAVVGTRGALAVVGSLAPVVCVIAWTGLARIDRSIGVRTDIIGVLRQVPMLRPLPVPAIEHLAHSLRETEWQAGQTVFEAGDSADAFYVVAHGCVEIVDGLRVVRRMCIGEGFGEIALLGRSFRSMTVRAVVPTMLYAISADEFLRAVTSISEARSTGEAVRWHYLFHAPGAVPEEPERM